MVLFLADLPPLLCHRNQGCINFHLCRSSSRKIYCISHSQGRVPRGCIFHQKQKEMPCNYRYDWFQTERTKTQRKREVKSCHLHHFCSFSSKPSEVFATIFATLSLQLKRQDQQVPVNRSNFLTREYKVLITWSYKTFMYVTRLVQQ